MSMRRYEVVFVLAPLLTEDEVKTQIETYSDVAAEKGAKVLQVDEWGKRRLAFPVKKNKEGIYVILTLEEGGADAVTELERRFRVSEAVIRFLTVRVDEDLKRAEKFGARRKRRKGLPAETTPTRATEPVTASKPKEPAPEAAAAAEEITEEVVKEPPTATQGAGEEAPEEAPSDAEPAAEEAPAEASEEVPAEEAASEEVSTDPEPAPEEVTADEPAEQTEGEEEAKDAETVEEK